MAGHQIMSVRNSLQGTSVLLTGGTGYLGSLVLEQILRCVPGVRRVYVVARDKGGRSAEHRIRRQLHSALYNHVRDSPDLLNKVALIKGDLLCSNNLGISRASANAPSSPPPSPANGSAQPSSTSFVPNGISNSFTLCSNHLNLQDLELGQVLRHTKFSNDSTPNKNNSNKSASATSRSNQANNSCWDVEGKQVRVCGMADLLAEDRLVVIHCGARIALQDPLKTTLKYNYQGTSNLLSLVRQLPGVCGFVHVSTAFVNCRAPFLPEGTAREQLYPLCFGEQQIDHADVVRHVMSMDDTAAEARSRYLCELWGFPNSYTLGKSLAECLLRDAHCPKMPVAIVRPSLVGSLTGKPYPGFVGNLAGPSGYAVAFALGFFAKNVPVFTPWNHLDCIPGDIASSVIVAAAAAVCSKYDVRTSTPQLHISHDVSSAQDVKQVARADENGTPTPVAIFHAASAAVNPFCFYETLMIANEFFKKHPVKFSFAKNMKPNHLYQPATWKSKLARRWLTLKVDCVGCLLRCCGKKKAAKSLKLGFVQFLHSQQKENNHRLWFDVSNVLALEQAIPEEERADFPLLWRGDWRAYAFTYIAGVMKLFMGVDVPGDHGFKHIPHRPVAH